MFFAILFAIFSLNDLAWEITDTGIYTPTNSSLICLSDDGQVFVADRSELAIKHYDAQGRFLDTFGGRGEGPGMFRMLDGLQWAEGRLFAFDTMSRRITVFNQAGKMQKTIKAPFGAFFPELPAQKIPGGWVMTNWGKTALAVVDESFTDGTALHGELTEILENRNAITKMSTAELFSPRKPTFSPAKDNVFFQVSRDRTQIYYYKPGDGFIIYVYDLKTQKSSIAYQQKWMPTPFDRNYGEMSLERYQEARKSRPAYREGEPPPEVDFPEHFPAIQRFYLDTLENLTIFPGSNYLHPETPPLYVTTEGKKITPPYPYQWDFHIFARQAKWIYMSRLSINGDGDEELTIRKIEANHFVEWGKKYLQ